MQPILFYLFTLLLFSSVARADTQPSMNDPVAAESFDYCTWERQGEAELLALAQDRLAAPVGAGGSATLAGAALVRAGIEVSAAQPDTRLCRKIFVSGRKALEKALAKAKRMGNRGSSFNLSMAGRWCLGRQRALQSTPSYPVMTAPSSMIASTSRR